MDIEKWNEEQLALAAAKDMDRRFLDAMRWLAKNHLRPLVQSYKVEIGGLQFDVDPKKGV